MFKFAALISIMLVIGAESQRPPYAGSAHRYPEVLPRFQDKADADAKAAADAQANIANRVGEGNSVQSGSAQTTTVSPGPTTSTTPNPLPVDELGYADSIDKIKDLPVNQQPYWYVNRHQIAQHLNPVGGTSQDNVSQTNVRSRSPFAG